MVKDHKESLAIIQGLWDKENEEVSSKHQSEVDGYKSQLEQITAELAEKIAKHKSDIESLTYEKDSLINEAKSRLADREKELQEEIKNLTDAFVQCQLRLMVKVMVTVLMGSKFEKSRIKVIRITKWSWRCVPPEQSLQKL